MRSVLRLALALALTILSGLALPSMAPLWARAHWTPGYWVPLPAGTVTFPKEPIGNYLLQRAFRDPIDFTLNDVARGKAAGVIHKPAGTLIQLRPFYDQSDKLKKLESLQPDDIQILDLRNADQVTSQDIKHIAKLTGLVELDLTNTDVGDAGVHELVAMKNIRALTLRDIDMTNNGVKDLLKMPNLKILWIAANKKIDDAGADYVARMKGLIGVDIGYTGVKDKGVNEVTSQMTQLLWLNSDNVRFSDQAIGHIAGLSKLQRLSIVNSKVTDASVPILKKLKTLTHLDIRGTHITPKGVLELRQTLPACEIKAGESEVPFFTR